MLELIAFLTMTIDHIGKVFFPNVVILQLVGRLAFIIYAFYPAHLIIICLVKFSSY